MNSDPINTKVDDIFSRIPDNPDSVDWDACIGAIPASPTSSNLVSRHRGLAVVLSLLLLSAACSIPVEQEEIIGFTVNGLFGDQSQNMSIDEVRTTIEGLLPRSGELESLDISSRAMKTGMPVFGTFVISLPNADESEALALSDNLQSELEISSVFVRSISVDVKRPWAMGLLPNAIRNARWASRITTDVSIRDEEFSNAISQHANQLQQLGIQLSIKQTADGKIELEFSGSESAESWSNSRTVFSTIGEVYSRQTGMPLVMGSEIIGNTTGDDDVIEHFYAQLESQKDYLFGESSGIAVYRLEERDIRSRKYVMFHFVLPGTPMSVTWQIEERLRELPGVFYASANSLVFE